MTAWMSASGQKRTALPVPGSIARRFDPATSEAAPLTAGSGNSRQGALRGPCLQDDDGGAFIMQHVFLSYLGRLP
ncbi:hypothetical protein GCM10027431_08400 [Lysobacter rhizosphaerae]